MKNTTVLVTGANGFLGRNISKHFHDNGWRVLGIGLGSWEKNEEKNWGLDFWFSSKVNSKTLGYLQETPDVIVHAAGNGSVEYSISHPKEDFEANVSSVLPVLEFIKLKCPSTRLIYPSSVAVYGNLGDFPIRENAPLKPVSPYGFNKKKAEGLLESYSKKFNENISIIRFFSIYGPGLRKQLFWDACEKIRNSAKDAVFFGTGEETRDWINIKDACGLIYKMASSKNKFEILNGGTGNRIEIKEVLEILVREYGKSVKIIFSGKTKKGDPKYYHANISKALKTGWKPTIELNEGISEYVKFYKENL